MDRQEGHATARSILRIVLIFSYSSVKQKPQIQIKESLSILIDSSSPLVFFTIQDIYTVKILELSNYLSKLRKISRRADIHDSNIDFCIKN